MKKRLLSIFLAVAMVLCLTPMAATAADGDVAINETNFRDANFRTFVELHFDGDHDNILSSSVLEAVKKIDCNNTNISSLTGIEYFTNLEELFCYTNGEGTMLTSLDVSKNAKLNEIDCLDNCYAITAAKNTFDLSTLSGSFDVKKASNWNGATVTNGKNA